MEVDCSVSIYTGKILFTLGISISSLSRSQSVRLATPKRRPGCESLYVQSLERTPLQIFRKEGGDSGHELVA